MKPLILVDPNKLTNDELLKLDRDGFDLNSQPITIAKAMDYLTFRDGRMLTPEREPHSAVN